MKSEVRPMGLPAVMVRRAAAAAARNRCFSAFVSVLERCAGDGRGRLPVLMYHRIDVPASHAYLSPGVLSATPDDFARQMAHLAEGYHVVSMAEVLEAVRSRAGLPEKAVLLTFDDAYRDFRENAWPVLRRHGLPATVFVATAYPDRPERCFWWDRLYRAVCEDAGRALALMGHETASRTGKVTERKGDGHLLSERSFEGFAQKRPVTFSLAVFRRLCRQVEAMPYREACELIERVCGQLDVQDSFPSVMTWDELRELAAEGVTLGAHTRTHCLMNRVSLDEAREEAVGSQRDLEREIGSPLPVFAYPGGALSTGVAHMLREEGFQAAFTTRRGINDLRTTCALRLRRINVGRRTPEALWKLQLLPWTRTLNRLGDYLTGDR